MESKLEESIDIMVCDLYLDMQLLYFALNNEESDLEIASIKKMVNNMYENVSNLHKIIVSNCI